MSNENMSNEHLTSEQNARVVASTWSGPLTAPPSIPTKADIVIIGGGIVGVSTAWFLARQGVNVVLCEKGHIAGEQSSRNWGWVRQQGRDPRELPMMIESMRIWRTLAEDIGEEVGFSQGGCIFAARKDSDIEGFQQWLDIARDYELDTRLFDGDELRRHVEGSSANWIGGLYTASDGRAEPHKAGPAIGRAAAREGATILTSCAVRGIESSAGTVSAVVTEHGTIRTSVVLCAAGAWTSMFCRSLGISVPQLKVRGTVARTAPARELFIGDVFDQKLGIRRRQDGGYTVAHGTILDHAITPSTFRYAFKFLPALFQEIGSLRISLGRDFIDEFTTPKRWGLDEVSPFEKTRVLNPLPNPRVVRGIRKNLDELFPALAKVGIVETWAGMVETSPDVVPMIGEVGNTAGFYIASGFSGHGFGIGPGAGKALAAMLTGADNPIDLEPFRLGRFFDGSPIKPMSAI
ncbi:MAG: glycine/D-amino acid oxidase-like deaminating enzyme [Woeseiaceae bacterium]|jgi:glycine/D-amino acid oxidase-like deaminating enzyme